jgi:hypothetical protein
MDAGQTLTPTGKIYRSSIATMWVIEDGILGYRIDKGAVDTKIAAQEWIAMSKRICDEQKQPYPPFYYVDITLAKSISREARLIYMHATENVKAVALITKSAIAKIVGGFMMGLTKVEFPQKLFTDDQEALDWLRALRDQQGEKE